MKEVELSQEQALKNVLHVGGQEESNKLKKLSLEQSVSILFVPNVTEKDQNQKNHVMFVMERED